MQEKTIEKLSTLSKKAPTKSLLIHSMPCEKKAAHIRNQAIEAMEKNEAMEVGYR